MSIRGIIYSHQNVWKWTIKVKLLVDIRMFGRERFCDEVLFWIG